MITFGKPSVIVHSDGVRLPDLCDMNFKTKALYKYPHMYFLRKRIRATQYFFYFSIFDTPNCRLYTSNCRLYTSKCRLYSLRWITDTSNCRLYTSKRRLYSLKCIFDTSNCRLYTLYSRFYTSNCRVYKNNWNVR